MSHLFKTIRGRLLLTLGVALTGMFIVAAFALISDRSMLLEDRQIKTKHLVETAVSLVKHYHGLQQQGTLPEAQAQNAALQALKALRYDKDEYFWVNDVNSKMIMHPIKAELDGKDVSQTKDPNGKFLFQDFARIVKKDGAGFSEYLWPKPGFDKPVAKVSYVQGFTPWGWIIGSGIYIDDIDSIFLSRAAIMAALVLGIISLIGLTLFFLIRSIMQPIQEIKTTMQSIQSTNDLSRRVTTQGNNELTEISISFNQMLDGFQKTIHQVADSIHEVMSLSSRLSSSASEVAQSSAQQNQASSQISAAMDKTKASIDQVANNSSATYKIAEEAGQLSQQGEQIVANAAAEMTNIADAVQKSAQHIKALDAQSDQISSIVSVIRDVADQTNLLALNAAIEAARAGEQGRGFAVVADEVRKLAERTSKSTGEISTMIQSVHSGTLEAVQSMQDGSARVQDGVNFTQEAGAAMGQIRQGAHQVIQAVNGIVAEMQAQKTAAQEMLNQVERIVSMSQQNRNETGEIAEAAQRLEKLATELKETINRFKA